MKSSYKSQLIWKILQLSFVVKSALLTHEQERSILQINCREFLIISPDQTMLFWKRTTDWESTNTTAYNLKTLKMNLTFYIDEFSSFYLKKSNQQVDYLSQIFRLTQLYTNVGVLSIVELKKIYLM